jgi:hypothetical protein
VQAHPIAKRDDLKVFPKMYSVPRNLRLSLLVIPRRHTASGTGSRRQGRSRCGLRFWEVIEPRRSPEADVTPDAAQ